MNTDLLQKRAEHIKTVCKATGWDEKKALEEMKKAKAIGMPYYRYVKNECWTMGLEEIKTLNEKIELRIAKNQEKLQEHINNLCAATGWSEKKSESELKKAKKLGISYNSYMNKVLYELTDDELQEFAVTSEKLKEKRRRDKAFYVEQACLKSGWDEKKILEEMEKMKEEYGISYLKFAQMEFWHQDEKNRKRLSAFFKTDKTRVNDNKEYYIKSIMEATGWSRGKVELEVSKAKVINGASYEDYFVFKLYDKTPEQQKEYVTLDLANKMRIKYNNHFEGYKNFKDKAQFNRLFSDKIERKWFINEDLSYEDFKTAISGLNKVIIKPLDATQGKGIEVAECNVSEEADKALYEHIVSLDKSIVEQYIVQHDDIKAFCETSVNTVRVMTLHYNGECKFLYSVFRMGRDGVVDNFHAGGIAATIDIPTGTIKTHAVDLDGNVFTHSPATGKEIKGFKMPNWDKVLDVCRQISGRTESTKLIGWDFAITPTGVDLIEGNSGASYVVAQIPLVQDGVGLANDMVLPYL